MKHFTSLVSLFLILFVTACGTGTQQQAEEDVPRADDQIQDELYQNVIAIHDEAMLKMETIMNLKGEAIKEVDSLRAIDSLANADRMALLENMQIELESANKSMMIWMREFRPPSDTTSHRDAMDYLKAQEAKITEVDDQMTTVIEKAKAL